MNKLKQVFLLRSRGIQLQSIAKTLGSSRNTVKKYLKLANQTNLSLTDLAQMDEADLLKLFADPVQQSLDRYQDLERLFPWMSKELERTGVNRWGLWGEYKSMYPDGYSYSQFCEHYKQWSESENAVMHMDHKPGDKCFIDFTGKKLQIVDRVTGEIKDVEVYVAVLGFSQFTYVEALYNQKLGSFIQATENAIRYFGGVPCALVPDNLKSAVTKADKYEPTINEEFLDFANHYRTAILPARSRKPRDKAHVEKAVSIVYSRIFAPLRDQVFFSLYELNQAINELLKQYNDCCFQRENISRRQRFINEEKSQLIPLPDRAYEVKSYKKAKVMKNCHVQLDKRYYSVPYRYIGKSVKIIYTQSQVHIFHKEDRIAIHQRGLKPFNYTTVKEHLPSTHRFVSEWNPEKFIRWAGRISPVVEKYIITILEQKPHPEQAYRSCVGILAFEKKLGKERLIKAIQRATFYQVYNYKTIRKILEGKLDMLNLRQDEQTSLPLHQNIRGAKNYQ